MKSAPAASVSADIGAWRRMVWGLLATVLVVQWSWALAGGRASGLFVASMVTLASIRLLAAEGRRPSARLRWDGVRWSLPSSDRRHAAEVCGAVAVVADLGGWILVVFRPEESLGRSRRSMPFVLTRRYARGQWHALRCALYSPQPTLAVRRQEPA